MNAQAAENMSSFYDQLSCVGTIFDSWTPCERTVVLCALLRRVPWYNLKLLNRAIDTALAQQASPETEKLEVDANDAQHVTETAKTTDENDAPIDMGEKLTRLLTYLPLLEPNNERVKEVYLSSIPSIIQLCVDADRHLHECQQLLSYMLIHPGLDTEDRQSLGQWLRYLENHLSATASREMWQQRMDNGTPPNGNGSPPPNGHATPQNGNRSPNGYGYYNGYGYGNNGHVYGHNAYGNYGGYGNAPNGNGNSNGNGAQNDNETPPTGNDNRFPMNGATSLGNFGNGAFRRTIGRNVDLKSDSSGGGSTPDNLNESFTKNGRDLDISSEGDGPEPPVQKPRSNSLTPPTLSQAQFSSSAENLNKDEYFVQKPRSFSLSSEHMAQMKPLLATTGSETRLDMLKSQSFGEHPGMTTVAQWLKSLRLHKYVWLFSNISYEQMMAMDDEYLQKLGVTKGARHKLLLCISKLHERDRLLEAMHRELSGGVPPPQTMALVLEQLREVLVSPIPPDSHLPLRLVELLELASKRLLSGRPQHPPLPAFPAYNHHDERSYEHPVAGYDPVSLHCWLVDRALHHPSFNCDRGLCDTLKRMRYRLPPRQYFSHLSDLPFTKKIAKPRWRTQAVPGKLQPCAKRPPPGWLQIPAHSKHGAPTPSPREHQYKSSSYPLFPPAALGRASPRLSHHASINLGDINCRLESLCLQMTEHAIN